MCAPKSTASAAEVEESGAEGQEPECRKPAKEKPSERKKRRPKKLGTSPPSHPIGEVRRSSDGRITPTWGTNLLEVKERTDIGNIEEQSKASKALEEQVEEMLEAEDDEGEQGGAHMETLASKTKDMIQVIEEVKHGRMDKPKKPPSRLAKLGDRSRVQTPKSIKAPKIPVKGMKKGKGKGKYQVPIFIISFMVWPIFYFIIHDPDCHFPPSSSFSFARLSNVFTPFSIHKSVPCDYPYYLHLRFF